MPLLQQQLTWITQRVQGKGLIPAIDKQLEELSILTTFVLLAFFLLNIYFLVLLKIHFYFIRPKAQASGLDARINAEIKTLKEQHQKINETLNDRQAQLESLQAALEEADADKQKLQENHEKALEDLRNKQWKDLLYDKETKIQKLQKHSIDLRNNLKGQRKSFTKKFQSAVKEMETLRAEIEVWKKGHQTKLDTELYRFKKQFLSERDEKTLKKYYSD